MGLTSPRFRRNSAIQAAAENKPPLKNGDRGKAVEVLQQALLDLGFKMPISTARSAVPDGIFGQETEGAVKSFQRAHGLGVDGIAGRNTLARMDSIFLQLEAVEREKLLAEATSPPPIGKWSIS